MPVAIQADLWGLLSGSALLLGPAVGWFIPLSRRIIASIMAFGAGVLISALSFELMDEAGNEEVSIQSPRAFSAALFCTPLPTRCSQDGVRSTVSVPTQATGNMTSGGMIKTAMPSRWVLSWTAFPNRL